MKKLFLVGICSLFVAVVIAQEVLTPDELKELRKNPDTSNTVYAEKVDDAIEIEESEEVSNSTMREDPENPGAFITEVQGLEPKPEGKTKGITFGKMSGDPMSESSLQKTYQTSENTSLYTGIDLEQHALRISANCEASNTAGSKGGAVIVLGDSFYLIPTKGGELPPLPGPNGDVGVMGIDINNNCVRDDVEHFIFNNYGAKDQANLRKFMYAHAIWLRFYLIENVSEKSIQAVARQLLKTGTCLNKMMSQQDSEWAQTEIFALMHNTDERTQRYFTNEEKLTGFDVDVSASPAC